MGRRGKTHRWSEPDRHPTRTIRHCLDCGLMKITRHEPEHNPPHWTEFWRGTEKVAGNVGTPACQPIASLAALEEA